MIICAHPNRASLNGRFMRMLAEHLRDHGNQVVIRDLYTLNFNPVLSQEDLEGQRNGRVSHDVKTEQQHIIWADCITLIHPIWWTGLPAMLKGYIERVFSYGFAYCYDRGVQKGLLAGKQAIIINTHGKSHEEYRASGMDKALLLTSDTGIYHYCGLEVKEHFFFDKADRATVETLAEWIERIKSVY